MDYYFLYQLVVIFRFSLYFWYFFRSEICLHSSHRIFLLEISTSNHSPQSIHWIYQQKKVGLRIKELERIYGIRNGSSGGNGSNQYTKLEPKVSDDQLSQSDIAEMIGISVDTLNNFKKLTELIPELEDLVDTGIVTKDTALAMIEYVMLVWYYIICRCNEGVHTNEKDFKFLIKRNAVLYKKNTGRFWTAK